MFARSFRRSIPALALWAVAASPLAAQPYLIANINQAGDGGNLGSEPIVLGEAGGVALFSATDFAHGRELWASDGSASGTTRLTDLVPGLGDAQFTVLGTVGGRLLVAAAGAAWATDGTAAGTRRLTSELLDPEDEVYRFAKPLGMLADPPRLVFTLTPNFDDDLWVSDGTPEGTSLLGPLSNQVLHSVATGDTVLFVTGFGDLWRTDGTVGGTFLIEEIDDGVVEMASLGGGRALLSVSDFAHGSTLWVTDGTAAGTRELDLPDDGGLGAFDLRSDGSGVVFYHRPAGPLVVRLWSTDGTAAGTTVLTGVLDDLASGQARIHAGTYYNRATDDAHGAELLVSDGTLAGTRWLDVCPGICPSFPTVPVATSLGLLFQASDGIAGREPWRTDGTPGGTTRMADLCAGSCGSFVEFFADLGGAVALSQETSGFHGFWRLDAGGAVPLGFPGVFLPSGDRIVAVADGVAVFAGADAEHGLEPWRLDGTSGGTTLVADLAQSAGDLGSGPTEFVPFAGEIYFEARQGATDGLWRTDGTTQGTESVAGLFPAGQQAQMKDPVTVGSDLFFLVEDPGDRCELWRSDGTAAGTVRLLDEPLTVERPACGLAALGPEVYVLGPGLWVSGRSPGSARRIADLTFTLPSDGALDFGVLDGRLYVSATDSASGFDLEPWTTDGTAAGTRRVDDVRPGANGSRPLHFHTFDGALYFFAEHDSFMGGLWRTDGTAEGTELVWEFTTLDVDSARILGEAGGRLVFYDRSGILATDGDEVSSIASTRPDTLTEVVSLGGRLWFVGESPSFPSFYELVSTDGTAEGTLRNPPLLPPGHVVADVWGGEGLLVLLAFSAQGGYELWAADGTAAGSRRLGGVPGRRLGEPGPPFELIVHDGRALFASFAGGIGTELFGVDLDGALGPFGPPAAPSGLAAESVGESSVLLTWRDESSDETAFRVRGATFEDELGGRVDVPAGATSVVVQGLPPGVPFTFTVAAVNAMGASAESGEVSATPLPGEPEPCAAGGGTLCLLGGRFGVSVVWRDQHNGGTGVGGALPLPGADRTGRFWFFHPDNVELIVKALDGRPVNGAFWSFFGALSDVEYWVTVVDSATGRSRTYHNRPGEICGVPDTEAFPQDAGLAAADRAAGWTAGTLEVAWPATIPDARPRPRALALPVSSGALLHGPATPREGTCVGGPQTLCLLADRLRVEVSWHDQHNGGSGTGQAVPGSEKTGYFWFFNADNLELVVKALDSTPVNGHLWLFYGALSDVEYTITVTDTVTQAVRSYHNPPGEFCGRGDTAAF